ncbi:hypothetical protein ID866_11941 [Astraeus odoratus]|nr:hypothetical protein ID866_11941 [Astraeus odoratus]
MYYRAYYQTCWRALPMIK